MNPEGGTVKYNGYIIFNGLEGQINRINMDGVSLEDYEILYGSIHPDDMVAFSLCLQGMEAVQNED